MGKWEIAKDFNFEYGHRVYTQELNGEFSLDTRCACRHHHGHSGKVTVYLSATSLTNSMVTDFKHLNWFKQFLDDHLDHKMILGHADPFNPFYFRAAGLKRSDFVTRPEGFLSPKYPRGKPKNQCQHEIAEGIVLVPFVPTSENLSVWLHGIVQDKMKGLGIKVSRVQFFETAKSQANFYSDT
jgi:6-pyruvoyltetrahydropterin/6-carboxytetrahydropterin synthase